ncbi:hypothetical protein [Stenotrophomonas bentonitica]|uniref:hypothetical protein n=1 Tax=Stenotrophomonas bentonitica TaxID=1450134 RepID=UPI00345F0376
MTFRCHRASSFRARVLPLAALLAVALSAAAQAGPPSSGKPAAGATGLRMQLRVVDACRLPAGETASGCTTAHQRSDATVPPPPQVQALTPPPEGGQQPRAWQTITF